MPHYPSEIEYSDKYYDELFEYRHVQLPKVYTNQCQKEDFYQKRNGDH